MISWDLRQGNRILAIEGTFMGIIWLIPMFVGIYRAPMTMVTLPYRFIAGTAPPNGHQLIHEDS